MPRQYSDEMTDSRALTFAMAAMAGTCERRTTVWLSVEMVPCMPSFTSSVNPAIPTGRRTPPRMKPSPTRGTMAKTSAEPTMTRRATAPVVAKKGSPTTRRELSTRVAVTCSVRDSLAWRTM